MALLHFNAAEVEPAQAFEILPHGKYESIITDSEMKDTKSGTGQYLQLVFTVVGPTHEGRKLWARLNLVNQNSKAVEIAQRELSAICHAVGKPGEVEDSEELHDIPLIIQVGSEAGMNGNMVNKIFGYSAAEAANIPSTPAFKAKAAAKAATGKPAAMPWAKK